MQSEKNEQPDSGIGKPIESLSNSFPVRLWPGFVILILVLAAWTIPPLVAPRTFISFISLMTAPELGTLAAILWWTLAARVHGRSRWLVPVLAFVPIIPVALLFHESKERVFIIFLGQITALAVWVTWLAFTTVLSMKIREIGLSAALICLWIISTLIRIDGAGSDSMPQIRWCWQLSDEEKSLAARKGISDSTNIIKKEIKISRGDWPGFRGERRDGLAIGTKIDPDWKSHPPELIWKNRVGPGWGSFAVVAGKLFTQEQLGTEEAIVCYDATTGEEIWEYKDSVRFDESISGAGPRATPSIDGEKLYARGATGKLYCLQAKTGTLNWSADIVALGGAIPQWGFADSPLVFDNRVFVYAGGGSDKGVMALNADNGELVWSAGNAKHGYSSVHLAKIANVSQVLLVSDYGVESFSPNDGKKLWESTWQTAGNRSTQPIIFPNDEVIIGTGIGSDQGLKKLRIIKTGEQWQVESIWSSRGAKPYFNDGVVLNNHYYGFDGNRFCCVDLADGSQKWKESTYGYGQVIGLEDQNLLIVQAENGQIALVEAKPSEFSELAKINALTGKTWNHPVVVHNYLYLRNGQEAICFKLHSPSNMTQNP